MAAVGERDAVLAFAAMGLSVSYAESAEEASRAVNRLAADGFAVIFITERAAGRIPETLERYRARQAPIVIPIPGSRGNTGLGARRLRADAEKAIGADILFDGKG
jgi:V/A-type H+-transporting ATPase subunit F